MNKFIVALIAFILVASSFSMKIRSTESDTSGKHSPLLHYEFLDYNDILSGC